MWQISFCFPERLLCSTIAGIRVGTRKRKNFDPCTCACACDYHRLRQGRFNGEIRIIVFAFLLPLGLESLVKTTEA